jgi:hypothetical protein
MFRPLGSKLDSESQMRATTRRRLVRSRSAASAPAALAGRLSLPGSEESAPDVRDLPIYEVRSRWIEAIASAATQLIITTRAVSQGYLQELLPHLTKILELGVRVYLGIASDAIQINRDGKPLDLPIAVLTVLQKKFEGLTVQLIDQLTVTHLVIDNRVLLVGDYDWLTPEGSPIRQFRHTWMLETDTLAILEKESARVLSDFKLTNAK